MMNERIKKLKDQCWVERRWNNDMWIEKHIDLEKFAELIVRECCDQVRMVDAMEIKKHFGVEL
jgi:hypothetical protein